MTTLELERELTSRTAERNRFARDRDEVCKALKRAGADHPGMSPAENVDGIVTAFLELKKAAHEFRGAVAHHEHCCAFYDADGSHENAQAVSDASLKQAAAEEALEKALSQEVGRSHREVY